MEFYQQSLHLFQDNIDKGHVLFNKKDASSVFLEKYILLYLENSLY